MKKVISIIAMTLCLVMVLGVFAGCKDKKNDPKQETQVNYQTIDDADIYTEGAYKSVYEVIGRKVTIDKVTEKDGLAYATVDGKEYELGMDFLSMAMVYNTDPIEGNTKYDTSDEIYNEWWKLYIQRWNYLMPEVPLYSNDYYDVYNKNIKGYSTNPYWGTESAILYCSGVDKVTIGSITDLTGSFRYPAFGKSNPSASDLDIDYMVNGLKTVTNNQLGVWIWDNNVVESHSEKYNEDGSKTVTIQIKKGLKYSNGVEAKAQDYLAKTLVFSSPVGNQATGKNDAAGKYYVGYDAFKGYTGTEKEGTSKYFSGLHLVDDYTFTVTIDASNLPYYYDIQYMAFDPQQAALWLGSNVIKDDNDGKGVYISADFYKKTGDNYDMAATIKTNREDITTYGWAGPYYVSSYDSSTKIATLKINKNYAGNFEGQKPSIETVNYVKIVSETQTDQFKAGVIDILAGITGGSDTNQILKVVNEAPDKFAYISYGRAGYGKLGFRCDFGPMAMTEVRQAIVYSIDRDSFCKTFTGGYGSVVNGPYYKGSGAYQAVQNDIVLNSYTASADAAIAQLVAGGWIYNVKGTEFKEGDGIRYRKLAANELSKFNIHYSSIDGKYKTVKIDGNYYMPLAINWFCTVDNEVSEQLKTDWKGSPITAKIGMEVQFTQGEWATMLGELYQSTADGWNGVAMYSAFNFATGFTSTVYDYSYNWSIDPDYYDLYSIAYLRDTADFIYE